MKKVLMMVVGLMLLATSASAYGPTAQAGIYGELERTTIEFLGMGGFTVFTMINPSDNGVSVMEYTVNIEGDATVFLQLATKNPDLGFSSGDLFGGRPIAETTGSSATQT